MGNECKTFSEDLTAMALGELSGPALVALQRHLATCAACQEVLESTRNLVSLAEGLPRLAVSGNLHDRVMGSVQVEQEVLRLSAGERLRIATGFVAYKLKHSGTARFLLFTAAAQILVLLTLFLASGIKVQETDFPESEDVVKVVDAQGRLQIPAEEEEVVERLVYGPDDSRYTNGGSKRFDPPSLPLYPPRVDVEEEVPELLIKDLDRRIESENRLELSRYRMTARFSMRCKTKVLEGRGGDRRTEYAVMRGLQWLRMHQRDDGSWFPGGPMGGDDRSTVGITALCVAAFLSDGHSQNSGRYSETVENGINYLLSSQDGNGRFGWNSDDPGVSLFNQSTAVLVLAENYILCGGVQKESLAEGIQGLIALMADGSTEETTSPLGAYSDTWAAMALRTSVLTGIDVAGIGEAAARAEDKVALMARDEFQAGPAAFASMAPICTASEVALDALFQDEAPQVDPDRVPFPDIDHPETLFALLDKPDFREPSFLFFIGTALCEYGDELWIEWNRRVKSILLEDQQRDGLWPVDGDWPWIDGGDIYTTALNLLTLQVYYRYIKLEENCN